MGGFSRNLAVSVIAVAVSTSGMRGGELKALLAKKILPSGLPMEEVQRFCENRVSPPPEVPADFESWTRKAEAVRREILKFVVFRGRASAWRDAEAKTEWLSVIEGGPGYRIRKLRYEALPGLWIPALLYEPVRLRGRVPVVLNVNGHDPKGKAAPYKQIRCINQAKRGLIALNVEWLGMGQLRTEGFDHARMNQLDLCGTSGLAPFFLSMKRGLDVLLSLPHADPDRVAVAGLSGGGWQTIFISALDPRVTLSDPVAGYSSFRTRVRHLEDLGDSEQTPTDLAMIADYTHLTAMRAPRPTLLTYNWSDNCCFAAGHALEPLLRAAYPLFALAGRERCLRWHVNYDPGNHNFEKLNREALYRMLGDFFFPGDPSYDPFEIPSEKEVKSAEELFVELPEDNADFHSLALGLSKSLPRDGDIPTDESKLQSWRRLLTARLQGAVRAPSYGVTARKSGEGKAGTIPAVFRRFGLGGEWTVPAVELRPAEPVGTVLVIADGGRASAAGTIKKLLEQDKRVVAVDPYSFGENRSAGKGWLFSLLIASLGERPLGIEAAQVAAVARHLARARGLGPVTLVSEGPRSGVVALLAAVLEKRAISELRLINSLSSFKQIIEKNLTVREAPDLFCFGLLEAVDVKQLVALVAPRPVRFR